MWEVAERGTAATSPPAAGSGAERRTLAYKRPQASELEECSLQGSHIVVGGRGAGHGGDEAAGGRIGRGCATGALSGAPVGQEPMGYLKIFDAVIYVGFFFSVITT